MVHTGKHAYFELAPEIYNARKRYKPIFGLGYGAPEKVYGSILTEKGGRA
jgi:hypothetical protein